MQQKAGERKPCEAICLPLLRLRVRALHVKFAEALSLPIQARTRSQE